MARDNKLYLVWQERNRHGNLFKRLCGIFDNERRALKLKEMLDKNVVTEDTCWNIVPEDVYTNWPTVDIDGSDGSDVVEDGYYVSEYMGYTIEQRKQQEERLYLMKEGYLEAVIQVDEPKRNR